MKIVVNPEKKSWEELCRRSIEEDSLISERVEKIVSEVAEGGDEALIRFAKDFDGAILDTIEVSKENIDGACGLLSDQLKKSISVAAQNIEKFHFLQLSEGVDIETTPGVRCIQRSVPINRVGIYIPGGTAPLFSSVLMLAIPARVAGCTEIILCTPPTKEGNINPEILYSAKICGVGKIFMVGGAQAIASMAYGTETVPKVDKIFGPGNRYVTKAKQLVSTSRVAIDMPAGPSEVMILADHTACPDFVAADMLSQAEHGSDSQAILVTNSFSLAEKVEVCISEQLEKLKRKEFTSRSLDNSRIIVMDSMDDIIEFANEYAAEHLIISMDTPWAVVERITCAGSIFLGSFSPESAGDYASGTNHTLPTSGWAKSYSGVNVDSFMKKITIQELTPSGLESLSETIITMADAEGLDAHANAVRVRLDAVQK